jgi:hypothetical protein
MRTHHSLNRSHRRSSRSQMFIAVARTNLLMVDGGRHRSGIVVGINVTSPRPPPGTGTWPSRARSGV